MRASHAWALLLALTGCALAVPPSGPPPGGLPASPLEIELWKQLVGRWEGQVDLTFPDVTLLINSVRRVNDRWVVDALYGTTKVVLAEAPVTLEADGSRVTLTFTTPAVSSAVLTEDEIIQASFDNPRIGRRVTTDQGGGLASALLFEYQG